MELSHVISSAHNNQRGLDKLGILQYAGYRLIHVQLNLMTNPN